jgi:hypothetical protein
MLSLQDLQRIPNYLWYPVGIATVAWILELMKEKRKFSPGSYLFGFAAAYVLSLLHLIPGT